MAVFDLDGTLIRGNSSFKFCFYLVEKGVLPRFALVHAFWNYICFHCGQRNLSELHKKIFEKLLKGLKLSILETHIEPFLQQFLSKSCYLPAVESLRNAQKLGLYTIILSNAPSFLVKAMARYFCVDAWHATEYGVDKENRLTHISFIMHGKDKAACVSAIANKMGIKLSEITAHSDSHLDLPLLEIAGVPIGVNPDRALRKVCKRLNWKIL